MPAPSTAPTAVASATFTVPAEVVWAYRLDFANLPEYNPDVSGVSRVSDGAAADAAGGVYGAGARYTFGLSDPRRPGRTQPVELWAEQVESPTLVAAGMSGGSEAYEEFVVTPSPDGAGCSATLTLWVMLPAGLSDEIRAGATAASLESISKELRLMKEVLEGRASEAGA
jgi:hypothetical protein